MQPGKLPGETLDPFCRRLLAGEPAAFRAPDLRDQARPRLQHVRVLERRRRQCELDLVAGELLDQWRGRLLDRHGYLKEFLASLEGYPFQAGSAMGPSGINYNSLKAMKALKMLEELEEQFPIGR